MWFIVNIPSLGKFESKDIVSYAFKKNCLFYDRIRILYHIPSWKRKKYPLLSRVSKLTKKTRGFLRWGVSLNGGIPKTPQNGHF